MMETGGPPKQNGLDWFCGPHLVLGGYELAGGHSAAENERHVGPARALSRAGRERLPPELSPRCRRARERAGARRRHSRGVQQSVVANLIGASLPAQQIEAVAARGDVKVIRLNGEEHAVG